VPGFSIHRELGLWIDSGLTPAQALSAGTVNAAAFLKQQDVFVTEGLAADLVLLEANPLEDIGNAQTIIGVMLRGQWFSRTELDEALERIRLRYAR
jgi:imidazolonepropionase-like amidohydrolase